MSFVVLKIASISELVEKSLENGGEIQSKLPSPCWGDIDVNMAAAP